MAINDTKAKKSLQKSAVTADPPGQAPNPTPGTPASGELTHVLDFSAATTAALQEALAAPTEVTLRRASSPPTEDQALWTAIRNRTDAIGFNRYAAFIHKVLCDPFEGTPDGISPEQGRRNGAAAVAASLVNNITPAGLRDGFADASRQLSVYGSVAYQVLKLATHAFLLLEGGVRVEPPVPVDEAVTEIPGEAPRRDRAITYDQAQLELSTYLQTLVGSGNTATLPYLKRIVEALISVGERQEGSPFCEGLLFQRVSQPAMIELIWNYWIEQGYLVQTMNAITLRFQNRRHAATEPLANLALDPLRALSNFLWGRTQDEPSRLSVARRAHEYRYAYGLDLYGKAVADIEPLESRSKFIEAFHNLLYRAAEFYEADAVTTVNADGFRLLQAIKDVHRVLAEGANNQFDELKRQARVEMMMDQWLLARPEMREFLRGRAMVPYLEPWMGQVDTMRQLQKWGDSSVSHFQYLAVTGEQLLVSLRYGDWTGVLDQASAVNWARFWKPEVQTYLHSYHAVTGVALDAEMTDARRGEERYTQPSLYLRHRQLALQGTSPLPAVGLLNEVGTEDVAALAGPAAMAQPRLARRSRAL